jgi:hypothetical protein
MNEYENMIPMAKEAIEAKQAAQLAKTQQALAKTLDLSFITGRTDEEHYLHEGIVYGASMELLDSDNKINQDVVMRMIFAGGLVQLRHAFCVFQGNEYCVYVKGLDKGGGRRSYGLMFLFGSGEVTDVIELRQARFRKLCRYIAQAGEDTDKAKKMPERHVFAEFVDELAEYGRDGTFIDTVGIIEGIEENVSRITQEQKMVDVKLLAPILNAIHNSAENLEAGKYTEFVHGPETSCYYRFPADLFGATATQLEMPEIKLARLLDRFGLLFRQPSSVGYEAKVHIQTAPGMPRETKWAYLIMKPKVFSPELFDVHKLYEKDMGDILEEAQAYREIANGGFTQERSINVVDNKLAE